MMANEKGNIPMAFGHSCGFTLKKYVGLMGVGLAVKLICKNTAHLQLARKLTK